VSADFHLSRFETIEFTLQGSFSQSWTAERFVLGPRFPGLPGTLQVGSADKGKPTFVPKESDRTDRIHASHEAPKSALFTLWTLATVRTASSASKPRQAEEQPCSAQKQSQTGLTQAPPPRITYDYKNAKISLISSSSKVRPTPYKKGILLLTLRTPRPRL